MRIQSTPQPTTLRACAFRRRESVSQTDQTTEVTGDIVSLSQPVAPAWKRIVLSAASNLLALGHTLCSLPGSIAVGLAARAGVNEEVQRTRSAIAYSTSSTAMGGAMGSLVGGPVGLVCGAFAGYIVGNIGNHLNNRSGLLTRSMDAIQDASSASGNSLQCSLKAAQAGMRTHWNEGKQAGRLLVEGMLDGASVPHPPLKAGSQPQGVLKKIIGATCGATGVLINAPGGAVAGALAALEEGDETRRSAIARPLMLVATNVGKVIPGAAVAALLGGPVGVAVGTAVGVVTASLTSIIDGKYGIHKGIAGEVERAVKVSQEGHPPAENLQIFYRAGKGAMVGALSGTRQGWQRGYLGGVDIAGDLVSVPRASVK